MKFAFLEKLIFKGLFIKEFLSVCTFFPRFEKLELKVSLIHFVFDMTAVLNQFHFEEFYM